MLIAYYLSNIPSLFTSSNLEILYNFNQQDSECRKGYHVAALSFSPSGESYSLAVMDSLIKEKYTTLKLDLCDRFGQAE